MSEFHQKALTSINQVLNGSIDVQSFCAEYETLYNFERGATELDVAELEVFSDLLTLSVIIHRCLKNVSGFHVTGTKQR